MYLEFELAAGTNPSQGHASLVTSADTVLRMNGATVVFADKVGVSGVRLPGGWRGDKSPDPLAPVSALVSAALERGGS